MPLRTFFGAALCSFAACAGAAATNTFEAACCRAIDKAATSGSWWWQCSGVLNNGDAAFQNEIRETLVVNFPGEYDEALSCAGNTHNPKMRRLHAVLSTAIRQTATWRRIEDYSARHGFGRCFFPEGLEKLMLVRNPDGARTLWSFVWARGRKADVTIPLRASLRKFRARNRSADVSAQEMSEYRYDDGFTPDAPVFLMWGKEENETGPLVLHGSYGPVVEPQCAWRAKTRELAHAQTWAEFDREGTWRLLARRPETYASEDVLKALGRPRRSLRLRCKNCGGTDMRWVYEIGDADDDGHAIRHTLTCSFARNGRCRRWTWRTE